MIKIDVDTRKWEIPWEEKLLGVESDEKVKTLQFEVSKNEYFSGLNFTDSACYINYKNGNVIGQYGITDVIESEGKVTFTWEVSREATRYKGKTYAILCAKKVREDGTIIREWNSAMGQFNVYEGIEPSTTIIEEPEIDIISQLLAVAQQANANALTNIDKSEELIEQAQELMGKNDFFKGYIVKGESYSGESSNSGIKLHSVVGKTTQQTTNGYQLFDSSKIETKSQGGATLTNNDGSLTISGSGNLTENFSQEYYYSKEETLNLLKQGTLKVNGLGNISPNIIFGLRNKNTKTFVSGKFVSKNTSSCQITQNDLDTLGDDIVLSIDMYTVQGTQIVSGTIKPMIYIDGDGTWEQYTGGKPAPNLDYAMPIENVEISKLFSFGGNMFDIDRTFSGAHCKETKLSEQEIKVEVTAESTYQSRYYNLNENEVEFLKGKLVVMYSEISERSGAVPVVKLIVTSPSGTIYTYGKTTIPKNVTNIRIGLYVNNSSSTVPVGSYVVFKNIKIMVSDTENTSWKPYKFGVIETSLTLAQDDIYQNGQVTNNFVNENLGDLFANIVVSGDPNWYDSELSYSYELKQPKVNLKTKCPGKCTHFQSYDFNAFYNKSIETGIMNNQSYCVVNISKSLGICTTVEEFKTWLQEQDVRVLKELETPTTEEFKIPTIPSYYPYTQISTDNDLTTDITWKILADCDNSLKQEELEKRIEALEKQMIGG